MEIPGKRLAIEKEPSEISAFSGEKLSFSAISVDFAVG